jgi:nucleotide-binding universal stress UspA family protein
MPPDSTELRLLCVIDTPILRVLRKVGAGARSLRAAREAEAKQAEELLKRSNARLRANGLKASTAMEFGEPKVKILEQASKWGADLIVLGSHGRKGLKHFLLGSVSETVARHATCSVEIVRTRLGQTRQR